MQEELTKAKERVANTATAGQQAQVVTEPFGMTRKKATPELEPVEGDDRKSILCAMLGHNRDVGSSTKTEMKRECTGC